jgi:diguanylate cyclase (GGDEF)-like protein
MVDIDRFKTSNDMYGHLLGDQVLREIARTMTAMLRDYDRVGRFGGEEFSVLLPQTKAPEAICIAERIRSNIAALSITAPGAAVGERVHVTVSIGVAALDAGSDKTLPDLLAAADAALYRAKRCGRDQVQMISTTRGLSAAGSTAGSNSWSANGANGADGVNGADGDAHDIHPPQEPSAFRRPVTTGPVR